MLCVMTRVKNGWRTGQFMPYYAIKLPYLDVFKIKNNLEKKLSLFTA